MTPKADVSPAGNVSQEVRRRIAESGRLALEAPTAERRPRGLRALLHPRRQPRLSYEFLRSHRCQELGPVLEGVDPRPTSDLFLSPEQRAKAAAGIRVMLIEPWGWSREVNTGLGYLTAALRQAGMDARMVQMNAPGMNEHRLVEIIDAFDPVLIGYTFTTITYPDGVHLSRMTRAVYPHIPQIAGGPHVTLFTERFLRENPQFDFACVGEGEELIVELCRRLTEGRDPQGVPGLAYRIDGKVIDNGQVLIKDITRLPLPDYTAYVTPVDWTLGYPLVTSRGCPYRCSFCSVPIVSGKPFRAKTPESVVDELQWAKERYGITTFEVYDDTFTQKMQRVKDLCDLMVKRRLNLTWSCTNGVRADRTDSEMARKMKAAGCTHVSFGIESAEQQSFLAVQKDETIERIQEAIRVFREEGIFVYGFFIIGLPHQTYEGTMQSLKFALANGIHAHWSFLQPYEGTKLGEWARTDPKVRWLKKIEGSSAWPVNDLRPTVETDIFPAWKQIKAYMLANLAFQIWYSVLPEGLPWWKEIVRKVQLCLRWSPRNLRVLVRDFVKGRIPRILKPVA